MQVGWYNRAVAPEFALPDFDRANSLAVLVGNTSRLWEPFVAALRARTELLDDANPIERYTVESIRPVLGAIAPRWEERWAHDEPPRRVAMQRLAEVSGLAAQSPSFLSVHATYGPWIALRAVVVVDVPGPPGPPPESRLPCDDCEHLCWPRFQCAMTADDGPEAWREWLAVRDACPVGRAFRYGEDQIAYHYRKEREILRSVVSQQRSS